MLSGVLGVTASSQEGIGNARAFLHGHAWIQVVQAVGIDKSKTVGIFHPEMLNNSTRKRHHHESPLPASQAG